MPALFQRIPTVAWFGVVAFGLTVVAGGIWTALLAINLATSPALPWSIVVMAVLLWLLWRYCGGAWRPRRTAETRRRAMRAKLLPGPIFAWALVAGGLALGALVGFWIVLVQLVKLPVRVLPNFSSYPLLTVLLVLLMAPLVSALAEEIGFRGYFLGALEGQVRLPVAIGIAALVIAPAHSLTQGFLWPILLWYFCADVMFGVLASLTQSIFPGLVIHSLGLLIFFAFIWPNDAHRPQVLATGADGWFWVHLAQTILGAVLAGLAFRRLAELTKRGRGVEEVSVTPVPADNLPG